MVKKTLNHAAYHWPRRHKAMQRAEGAAQQAEDIAGLPENAVLTTAN
jgi:hypothetical protein